MARRSTHKSRPSEPSLAEAMGEAPCAVVCLFRHGEWHAHDVLFWKNNTSTALDWSEIYGFALYSEHASGDMKRRGNKVCVPRYIVDSSPLPRVWIAPSLVLCDGRWRPCAPERRGIELVSEPLCFEEIADRQQVGWSATYCTKCDDYMPFDNGIHCEHVWWCETSQDIRGATYESEEDPCDKDNCWGCLHERERRSAHER